ncbi:hypothetical protein CDQ92_13105 [Sphingopyxis bauzanensis]|uniref:Uncharacterized protein n=1 Tax=Sphingopyxis bauzanensis TaxID=651663 RepID=A0A246JRS3_9SPHN|nr:hypothetical protein [Sphingopyxis bauzanensis]OWQ95717.1 hypothetical protein CDQ92_13105 [Sphingopyxis bauzanensis]GGJ39448.1 hypothetical protein GCM10011393_07060 [Sphingopyxis bauzanensis]
MNGAGQIAAIRAVQAASIKLTLACAEIVGPLDIALGMAEAATLGEHVPDTMKAQVDAIKRKERK